MSRTSFKLIITMNSADQFEELFRSYLVNDLLPISTILPGTKESPLLRCGYCEARVAGAEQLTSHEKTHFTFECSRCHAVFPAQAALTQHVNINHTQQQQQPRGGTLGQHHNQPPQQQPRQQGVLLTPSLVQSILNRQKVSPVDDKMRLVVHNKTRSSRPLLDINKVKDDKIQVLVEACDKMKNGKFVSHETRDLLNQMEHQRRIELQEAFAILQESLIDAGKIPTKYCPLSKQNILDVAMKYCSELQNCDEVFQEQKQILQQRNEELARKLQQLQRQAVKQE